MPNHLHLPCKCLAEGNLRWLSCEGREGLAMKRGLVLEGGAMRGLFTAGVLDVLMEHGVTFDGVVGVSAGACFGCSLGSGRDSDGSP